MFKDKIKNKIFYLKIINLKSNIYYLINLFEQIFVINLDKKK